jgi:hypothetical protein
MTEKIVNGETKKLYIYKAGIQIGEEEYIKEKTEEGISLKTYTTYSSGGKKEELQSHLVLDEDYNTLKLETIQDSSSIYQQISFTYKDCEAHFKVDQESRVSDWKGKNVDQIIVWEEKCLVIPSAFSYIQLILLPKKYSFDKKGKQNVACGLVPKMIFALEYLGEDILEVDHDSKSCQRFQLSSSVGEKTADLWINEDGDLLKILFREEMITIQSYPLK